MSDESKLPPRVYPIPPAQASADRRFTLGLTLDVAEVLSKHGYPLLAAMDFVDLQQTLFRFLYKDRG